MNNSTDLIDRLRSFEYEAVEILRHRVLRHMAGKFGTSLCKADFEDVFAMMMVNLRRLAERAQGEAYFFAVADKHALRLLKERQKFVSLDDEQSLELVAVNKEVLAVLTQQAQVPSDFTRRWPDVKARLSMKEIDFVERFIKFCEAQGSAHGVEKEFARWANLSDDVVYKRLSRIRAKLKNSCNFQSYGESGEDFEK